MCKTCASIRRKAYYLVNKDREQVLIKKWHNANADKRRQYTLKKYGITQALYDELKQKQNNSCQMCGTHEDHLPDRTKAKSPFRLHVDHCHTTGQVRGLLCFNCNALLGHARDNTTVLQNAINYLTKKENEICKLTSLL